MDKDLKDTIRKLEEAKKKQEKLEKTIIILSGILIIIVFTVIGVNLYSGKEEKVSQPEINIVNEKPAETKKPVEEKKESKQVEIAKKPEQKVEEKKENKQIKKEAPKKVEAKTVQKPVSEKKTAEKKIEKTEKKVVKKVQKEKKTVEKQTKHKVATAQKGYYYIQLGAFSQKKNAEKAKSRFKIPASRFYIVKEGSLYKLLIGRFKTRKEAQAFMRKHGLKGLVKKI